MSISRAIEKLHIAESIEGLEFYVSKSENRGPELHCRIWEGFKFMLKGDVQTIATALNDAIADTKKRMSTEALNNAVAEMNEEVSKR